MKLIGFKVQMYKCILDSGKVEVTPLTVLVGKNESGKTALLKALHKFNPFEPEPYNIEREWPRAHRKDRTDDQVVCIAEFFLEEDEIQRLRDITQQDITFERLEITRDYGGRFEVLFPRDIAPDKLHPNDIDRILETLPKLSQPVATQFQDAAEACVEDAKRLAREGRFSELEKLPQESSERMKAARSPENEDPQYNNEQNFTSQFTGKLQSAINTLKQEERIQKKAHDFVVQRIPTFVYMDEYRAFQGMAMLDQLLQRKNRKAQTPEDETILTILSLAGLDLEELVHQGGQADREERQYDLDDGAATLTRQIEDNWGQLKYEVRFNADGPQFFTFVKDVKDRALIRLEERSRGFQWFFSFDLLLMHETKGSLKGCVILLDEPGLHLHPEGQRDSLKRLEAYAEGNTLIYSSHLPFMIDLQAPERIHILTETNKGTVVTEDLSTPQPEGKLTLQAALGISGQTSFLLSERNLVVEGVDDYWLITALSNLLKRSREDGLPDDLMVTAAGGASEVTYIATLITGQELTVVALYDSDQAGNAAKDKLVKRWLTKYKHHKAAALSLGPSIGLPESSECSIEDLFEESFYLDYVRDFYKQSLAAANIEKIELPEGGQLCKRVEAFFENHGMRFNKGSIAKRIRSRLSEMNSIKDLPEYTQERVRKLIKTVRDAIDSCIPGQTT